MTDQELLVKFNPSNAVNLTAEDLETMRALTDDQIGKLARQYPNTPTNRRYLRLYDKTVPENKQLFQMSTWQNLYNVRKFSGLSKFIPWTFEALLPKKGIVSKRQPTAAAAQGQKITVDLSTKEAAAELKRLIAEREATPTGTSDSGKTGQSAVPVTGKKEAAKGPAKTPAPAAKKAAPEAKKPAAVKSSIPASKSVKEEAPAAEEGGNQDTEFTSGTE